MFLRSFVPIAALISIINAATVTLSGTVAAGSSSVQFTSVAGFDSPKVSNVNSTTYQWYYFDVVSDDSTYSVSATFFAAVDTAFPFTLSPSMPLEVIVTVQTPQSDSFYLNGAFATDAQVNVNGDGASGVWDGTGVSFNGSSDLSSYQVNFDSANLLGITGSISMQSTAPAHYPCSGALNGADMSLMPGVGWANAIPDSQATVQLDINGQNISFTGSGYHDMNWGDRPFTDAVGTWHWGHGKLGPYSVVWFNGTSTDGTPYASGYVSMNGAIVGAQCSGVNVSPVPAGFNIEIDLGDEGVFQAQFATDHTTLSDGTVYDRYSGSFTGGMSGGEQYTGSAMFDEFDFTS